MLIDAIESDPESVREREVIYGRACSHRAQAKLGVAVAPVLRAGENAAGGMPVWQNGIVGSISHTNGYTLTDGTIYCIAAVGPAEKFRSIGIDTEYNTPLSDTLRNRIALPDEQAWLNGRNGTQDGIHWDRVLFSAKESVFKAWYPLTHRGLDFDDALITFDPANRTFTAQLLVEDRTTLDGTPLDEFLHGRLNVEGGAILTGIVVPQPDTGPDTTTETAAPQKKTQPTPLIGHGNPVPAWDGRDGAPLDGPNKRPPPWKQRQELGQTHIDGGGWEKGGNERPEGPHDDPAPSQPHHEKTAPPSQPKTADETGTAPGQGSDHTDGTPAPTESSATDADHPLLPANQNTPAQAANPAPTQQPPPLKSWFPRANYSPPTCRTDGCISPTASPTSVAASGSRPYRC